jgi:DNA ligase 4
LQLGQPSCPLKSGCILEGELVVYSDKHSKILDFHKIRKHVSRSGAFLGTDKDSQAHPWEHLMIVYYDLLMVDNESLLAVKHSERFQRLKSLITLVPGRSSLVKRELIDCGRRTAISDLRRAFAKCITARGEGLVLKGDDPYFDFSTLRRPYSCSAIKLKKEYIGHFGDIGDFAVVGARFDAAKARTYNIPTLKWTHFYVGCLENKEEVQRFEKPPRFVVTNVVELNATQLAAFISSVNPESVRPEDNKAIYLKIEPGLDSGKRPSVVFPTPPVFDIRCFSFDKEGNTGFWSPRFPSVAKIHCDRTYHDAISFAELQEMAIKEREAPPPEDSQELLGWIAALENSESKAVVDTASQSTVSTATGMMASSQPELNNRYNAAVESSPAKETSDSARPIPVGRVGEQPTAPTSFVTQMATLTAPEPIGKQGGAMMGRKRPLKSSTQSSIPERNKIRRCSGDQVASTAPLPDNNRATSSTNQKENLQDARMGPSRRNTEGDVLVAKLSSSVSMHRANSHNKEIGNVDARPALQAAASFHEGLSQSFAAPPLVQADSGSAGTSTSDARPSNRPSNQPTETTTGTCSFLPDSCKLPTYSILLSPCIADFPWVAEDLLSCHGVTEFLRDPKEWHNTTSTPNNTSTPAPSDTNTNDRPSHRGRKIILVDARRKEATLAFLQSVEAAQLKRRSGEREYVPAYDWRVLEKIREEEERCSRNKWRPGTEFDLNNSKSLWRRFWVGLA